VLFPNYGLLWERTLNGSLPALLANMAAWNRWCATVVQEGRGALHPVAHLTLRDGAWLEGQLAMLSRAGVRLAMIAPALVDGRPLSHPDHDRLWAAFCAHGISPVFHVAEQPRPFADAWYTDHDIAFVPALDAIFIHVGAALACTDLILNGTLERFPDLRLGIVELSAIWVPMYLMMLDGGSAFTRQLNGIETDRLSMRPSDYFRRQIRVSSFSYEVPANIIAQLGGTDLLMCGSDYPHSEGTSTPLIDRPRCAHRRGARPVQRQRRLPAAQELRDRGGALGRLTVGRRRGRSAGTRRARSASRGRRRRAAARDR